MTNGAPPEPQPTVEWFAHLAAEEDDTRHVTGIGLAVVMIFAMFFVGAYGYRRLLPLGGHAVRPGSWAVRAWR